MHVGGLSTEITDEDIKKEFSKFGEIVSCWVDKKTNTYGFVEFKTIEEADRAKTKLDGSKILGATIKVSESREKRDKECNICRSVFFFFLKLDKTFC